MAKQKSDVNKSEEIRQIFRSNPTMPVKEVIRQGKNGGAQGPSQEGSADDRKRGGNGEQ
jgi:hypothetical protein